MAYVITKTDFTEVKTSAPFEKYGDALRELELLYDVHKNGTLKRTGKVIGNYKKSWFTYVSTDTGLAIRFRIEVAK